MNGTVPMGNGAQTPGEFVRAQVEKWRRISAETGIKAE